MPQLPLSAVIFDLDGTLVDSNGLHVRAWSLALTEHAYHVGRDRIEVEIGKGGDQLVESILGKEVEDQHGDSLRKSQLKHSLSLIRSEGVRKFSGADELLKGCRSRGLRTALATSSSRKIQNELLKAAEIDPSAFDVAITGDDVNATKPQGDLYHLTVEKLKVSPAECMNVGDTVYDCIAGRKAGLVTIGLSGGLNDAEALRRAGARWTVRDAAELNRRLDDALQIAAPRSVPLTHALIEELMARALDVAATGMAEGEVPIGSVVARGDGTIIGRGFNRMNSTRDKIAHAEIIALHDSAGKVDLQARDLIVVSTLEPCVMCMGATMEAGIDTVLFGLPAPADGGSARVNPPTSPESQMPRIIGGILADRSRALLAKWLAANPKSEQAKFVRQLLDSVA